MSAAVVPLHLGAFHTWEWVLFLLLIAGPFLGLATTIVLVRRREAREDAAEAARAEDRVEPDRQPTPAG